MIRPYPALVTKLCHLGAWIVGSGADPDKKDPPRDWDVFVPYEFWHKAMLLIPDDAKPNTFGGWKCNSEGIEVDVWPDSLERIMSNQGKFAWQPELNIRIKKL